MEWREIVRSCFHEVSFVIESVIFGGEIKVTSPLFLVFGFY